MVMRIGLSEARLGEEKKFELFPELFMRSIPYLTVYGFCIPMSAPAFTGSRDPAASAGTGQGQYNVQPTRTYDAGGLSPPLLNLKFSDLS